MLFAFYLVPPFFKVAGFCLVGKYALGKRIEVIAISCHTKSGTKYTAQAITAKAAVCVELMDPQEIYTILCLTTEKKRKEKKAHSSDLLNASASAVNDHCT